MASVKGPNGKVYELDDRVAAGLVGKGNRGYEYATSDKQAAKSPAKKTTKSSTKK